MNSKVTRYQGLMKQEVPTLGAFDAKKDEAANRLKTFFKRWPALYTFLRETFGPTHSPLNGFRLRERVARLFSASHDTPSILNLGSGATRVHPDIINVDIFPLKEVDVVADVSDLPFRDGVIDGIVCDSVLEHLADPTRALAEMSRVLRPGGTLLITMLFLYPYHSSPDDFYRWTERGARRVLEAEGFSMQEVGIRGGPMGTLQGVLMHLFSLPFSFGPQALYFLSVQFFMVLFSPLKLLDPVFMLSSRSAEFASDMYVVATKRA